MSITGHGWYSCKFLAEILLTAVMVLTVRNSQAQSAGGNGATDGRYVARKWTTADGLPSNTVSALALSGDGYLWVGTPRGLCRFDGSRFIPCQGAEGMPEADIQRMVADPAGKIWVQDEEWNVRVREGRTFQLVSGGMAVDQSGADGSIWGLGRRVITRHAHGQTVEIPLPPDWKRGEPIKLLPTRNSGLLVLSWRGEIRNWQDGKWSDWLERQPVESDSGAGALLEDASGAVWVSTAPDIVWKIADGKRTRYSFAGPNHGFWQMCERQPGEIWGTGTDGAVWHLEGGGFVKFPLPAETIATRLLADPSGALWVATLDSGLLRLDRAKVETSKIDALPGGGRISALAELEPGVFAAGTLRNGTWSWREGTSAAWPPDDGAFQQFIYSNALIKTRDGTVWAGTNFAVHRIRENRRVTPENLAKLIDAGDSAMALHECLDGSILVGTGLGKVHRIRNDQSERLSLPGSQSAISDFAETADGSLWVSTRWDGVFRVKDNHVTRFDESSGLSSRRVLCLLADSRGGLWAGLGPGGLFSFTGKRFERLPMRGAGAANSVLRLIEDNQGWMWFGGDQGISGVSLALAASAMTGGAEAETVHAGLVEGMASEQCVPAKPLKTADGRLAFGTMSGFVRFRPDDLREFPEPPPAVVEEISINGKMEPLSARNGMLEIPPAARFEAHFTGIDLRHGAGLRFRYKLNGFETQWNEVGPRRFASYSKVPPGEYTLVVACGNAGQWNPEIAYLRLNVLPFFWQRTWVQVLFAAMIAGAVAFTARTRERQRAKARATALERLNAERSRIALDLHDGIGSGLTQVGMMAAALGKELAVSPAGQAQGKEVPATAAASARQLQRRIRTLAQDLDIAVWATSPRHDHAAALCTYLSEYLIEYFRDSGIRCWISVPDHPTETVIRPEARHHLFMGAREVMNNCLKHSQASEIRLIITEDGPLLTVTLSDNGTGFTPAPAGESRRNGLSNLKERMVRAGGNATVHSGPEGTSVAFTLTLEKPA